MDKKRYVDTLLSSIPGAKLVSGGKEIECKCFYCADGKDRNHGHFYIKVPQVESDPLVFNCVKCHTCGMITSQRLMEWNIYDMNLSLEITSHNKKLSSQMIHSFDPDHVYNLSNFVISKDLLSNKKLEYINNRLGTNLTFDDIQKNKIVLNLKDLLNQNRILDYTRHTSIVDQLDANFLGFLSYDNAFVNLRNLEFGQVYEGISKRYVNYSIFNKQDNTHKFYVLPVNIDMLNPNPIRVNIAEGPFDILSVKYNLSDPYTREHAIFVAITGSGYKGILRFLISTLRLMNLDIHIYRDNDMDWCKFEDLSYYLSGFGYHITIHSNTFQGEKDFGVSMNRIREVIQTI